MYCVPYHFTPHLSAPYRHPATRGISEPQSFLPTSGDQQIIQYGSSRRTSHLQSSGAPPKAWVRNEKKKRHPTAFALRARRTNTCLDTSPATPIQYKSTPIPFGHFPPPRAVFKYAVYNRVLPALNQISLRPNLQEGWPTARHTLRSLFTLEGSVKVVAAPPHPLTALRRVTEGQRRQQRVRFGLYSNLGSKLGSLSRIWVRIPRYSELRASTAGPEQRSATRARAHQVQRARSRPPDSTGLF